MGASMSQDVLARLRAVGDVLTEELAWLCISSSYRLDAADARALMQAGLLMDGPGGQPTVSPEVAQVISQLVAEGQIDLPCPAQT